MKAFSALLAGALFGAGLAVSGMADPANVLGFLVISPDWNPALLGVMGGAVITAGLGYALVLRMERPIAAPEFQVPTATVIDAKLVGGAALFGIGWGLAGYCPGPGVVGVAMLDARAVVFLVTFLAGMAIYEFTLKQLASFAAGAQSDG